MVLNTLQYFSICFAGEPFCKKTNFTHVLEMVAEF